MLKLYDINCSLINKPNIKKWEGKIIVNEEGWFEGCINYPLDDGEINQNLFIYGVYIPGTGIKIIENVPYRIGSILRQLSVGIYIFDENHYDGIKETGTDESRRKDGLYKYVILENENDSQVEFLKKLEENRNKKINKYKEFYRKIYASRNKQKAEIIELHKKIKIDGFVGLDFDRPVGFATSYIVPAQKRKV